MKLNNGAEGVVKNAHGETVCVHLENGLLQHEGLPVTGISPDSIILNMCSSATCFLLINI